MSPIALLIGLWLLSSPCSAEEGTCNGDSCEWDPTKIDVEEMMNNYRDLLAEMKVLNAKLKNVDEDHYAIERKENMHRAFQVLKTSDNVGVDAVELMALFHNMFLNKEKQKPLFVITYGPPGSGKSYILEKVARQYHYDLEKNFVYLLQDDMVKNISGYNREINELHKERPKYMVDGVLADSYYEEAEKVYFKYRGMIRHMKSMLLEVAFRQELNIVYETTGSKRRTDKKQTLFTIIDEAKARGYKIIMIYPYVDDDILIDRLDKRNKGQKRVVHPAKLPFFISSAKANWPHYLEIADAGIMFDNNIDKSNVIGRAKWLMKYRSLDSKDPGYRCHPDVCKYTIWSSVVNKAGIPICLKLCDPEGNWVSPDKKRELADIEATKKSNEKNEKKGWFGLLG